MSGEKGWCWSRSARSGTPQTSPHHLVYAYPPRGLAAPSVCKGSPSHPTPSRPKPLKHQGLVSQDEGLFASLETTCCEEFTLHRGRWTLLTLGADEGRGHSHPLNTEQTLVRMRLGGGGGAGAALTTQDLCSAELGRDCLPQFPPYFLRRTLTAAGAHLFG